MRTLRPIANEECRPCGDPTQKALMKGCNQNQITADCEPTKIDFLFSDDAACQSIMLARPEVSLLCASCVSQHARLTLRNTERNATLASIALSANQNDCEQQEVVDQLRQKLQRLQTGAAGLAFSDSSALKRSLQLLQ
jgi:hypothetical protein